MKYLSLFDYSGTWSQPFVDAGHTVIRIDIKSGSDVMDIDEAWLKKHGPFEGILAAPPCTDFAVSGAQYWRAKDEDGRTEASLRLLDKTLWIITHVKPRFWALENPVGRLNRLRPALAAFGPWYFQPYEFGDPWTKRTGLWGVFNRPEKAPVEPIRFTKQGSWTQKLGGKSERTKELRSITPPAFALAFYNANKP
jgi:hypothetical protein